MEEEEERERERESERERKTGGVGVDGVEDDIERSVRGHDIQRVFYQRPQLLAGNNSREIFVDQPRMRTQTQQYDDTYSSTRSHT